MTDSRKLTIQGKVVVKAVVGIAEDKVDKFTADKLGIPIMQLRALYLAESRARHQGDMKYPPKIRELIDWSRIMETQQLVIHEAGATNIIVKCNETIKEIEALDIPQAFKARRIRNERKLIQACNIYIANAIKEDADK